MVDVNSPEDKAVFLAKLHHEDLHELYNTMTEALSTAQTDAEKAGWLREIGIVQEEIDRRKGRVN